MENRFGVIENENGIGIIDYTLEDAEGYGILTTGFQRKASAKVICTALNELQEQADEKPLDLHKDFEEWNKLLKWLDKTSRRLLEIEEIYEMESKIILSEAIETGVDFKKLYGGNNQTTRKQYVDEQLKELIEEKNELKFLQNDDLRRIEFLKKIISMKLQLLRLQ